MAYKIFKIDKKNPEWAVVSLVDASGDAHENVSVNKVSKKGDIFPNFDTLEVGSKVEGRIWESDAKKKYLFAPKGGAKAPVKETQSEEEEYPVSQKLETILNKMTGMQIDIQIIKELMQPKKKVETGLDDFNEPAF